MLRVREILDSGALGTVRRIRSHFGAPFPTMEDIRFEYGLAGGALMDMGFYPVTAARFVMGGEPAVTEAEARIGPPEIDIEMNAHLAFSDGVTAHVSCAMHPEAAFEAYLEIEGEHGRLRANHPFLPQLGNSLTVTLGTDAPKKEDLGKTPSFHYQLRAFERHLRGGAPMWTDPANAIATMTTIDAIYERAGLPVRGQPG